MAASTTRAALACLVVACCLESLAPRADARRVRANGGARRQDAAAAAASAAVVVDDGAFDKETLLTIATRYMDASDAMTLAELTAPKDDIVQALNDMQFEIRSEAKEQQDAYDTFAATQASLRAQAQVDAADQERKVQAANAAIGDGTTQLTALVAQASSAERDKTSTSRELEAAKASLAAETGRRARAADDFADIRARHLASIDKVSTLIDMVADLRTDDPNFCTTLLADLSSMLAGGAHVHRASRRTVASLVAKSSSSCKAIASADPANRAATKARLLALLGRIRQGVRDSLKAYTDDDASDASVSTTTVQPGFAALIDAHQRQLDELVQQLAALQSQITAAREALAQANVDLVAATRALADLQALIDALNAQLASRKEAFDAAASDRRDDLDAIEAAKRYVEANVQGMTVAGECHIGAAGCYRCLYDAHCTAPQTCSAEGACEVATTAPTTAAPASPPVSPCAGAPADGARCLVDRPTDVLTAPFPLAAVPALTDGDLAADSWTLLFDVTTPAERDEIQSVVFQIGTAVVGDNDVDWKQPELRYGPEQGEFVLTVAAMDGAAPQLYSVGENFGGDGAVRLQLAFVANPGMVCLFARHPPPGGALAASMLTTQARCATNVGNPFVRGQNLQATLGDRSNELPTFAGTTRFVRWYGKALTIQQIDDVFATVA